MDAAASPTPAISLFNRQRRRTLQTKWLTRFARQVLPVCCTYSGDGLYALRGLEEITVALVSDRAIADLHQRFMQIPGATDVITFADGDIAISVDTAQVEAAARTHSLEEEIALYIVHGLLHLNGFDDMSPPAAARMRKVQDRIWRAGRAQLPFSRSVS